MTSILQGQVGRVIGGLRQRLASTKLTAADKATLERTIGYLNRHRQYMHYKRYLARGYPITTGVVESACGHVVKDRMEKSGARWTVKGAEAMLRLRSIYKNDDWQQYHNYRKEKEAQRLYPNSMRQAA